MVAMVTLGVFGALLVALAVRSFLRRGAPVMTKYWAATPAERAKLRTPQNYRFVGVVFAGLGVGMLAMGASLALEVAWLWSAGLVLGAATMVVAVVWGVRMEVRGG